MVLDGKFTPADAAGQQTDEQPDVTSGNDNDEGKVEDADNAIALPSDAVEAINNIPQFNPNRDKSEDKHIWEPLYLFFGEKHKNMSSVTTAGVETGILYPNGRTNTDTIQFVTRAIPSFTSPENTYPLDDNTWGPMSPEEKGGLYPIYANAVEQANGFVRQATEKARAMGWDVIEPILADPDADRERSRTEEMRRQMELRRNATTDEIK